MNDIDRTGQAVPERHVKHRVIKRRRQSISIALFVIAAALILAGIQGLVFFNTFTPRMADANSRLFDLQTERTRTDLLARAVEQLQGLKSTVDEAADEEVAKRLAAALQSFDSNFMESPRQALRELKSELPYFEQHLSGTGEQLATLTGLLNRLEHIYVIDYEQLMGDIESPPWYLWPTAAVLQDTSGYQQAVTYNRAMYLAQVGEIGTARVLLTGLHASVKDQELLGLVYYGLGRLQFEVFRSRPEPENYLQSVEYVRRSLQSDPELALAQRFYDFLLSLDQAPPGSQMGEGDPTTPTEGEGAAIFEGDPLF